MVDYARRVGGPALRRMTFHERARMLKAMAQHLMARKDEFYRVSAMTGATKGDSWIDIDGGIGTFFVYASKGRRELPDELMHIDGPVELLSKGGGFVGPPHLPCRSRASPCTSTPSTSPCGGCSRSSRRRSLAGVPAIVKPASLTSYLTEAVFREMIASGIFPEGAVQLLCGSAGDLLDHLDSQCVVAFTGSAATGLMLKSNPVDPSRERALQHGSGLAELLDARPRCRARDRGVRPLRQGSREGDDDEGGAEVHGHPPHARARAPTCRTS